MSTITLSTGPPITATLVDTDPQQLRFFSKADQAYTIRSYFLERPTVITSDTQNLALQNKFHNMMYLKFVSKTALARGDVQLLAEYEAMYQKMLEEQRNVAQQLHFREMKLAFSWD